MPIGTPVHNTITRWFRIALVAVIACIALALALIAQFRVSTSADCIVAQIQASQGALINLEQAQKDILAARTPDTVDRLDAALATFLSEARAHPIGKC